MDIQNKIEIQDPTHGTEYNRWIATSNVPSIHVSDTIYMIFCIDKVHWGSPAHVVMIIACYVYELSLGNDVTIGYFDK